MNYMQKDIDSISEDPTLLADTYSYFTSLLFDKKLDTSLTQTKTTLLNAIEWIKCDRCTVWLHLYCTQPQLTTIPANYICHFCKIKETK